MGCILSKNREGGTTNGKNFKSYHMWGFDNSLDKREEIGETKTIELGSLKVQYAYLSQRGFHPEGERCRFNQQHHSILIQYALFSNLANSSLFKFETINPSDKDDGAVRISTLNLVDLAGSESVRHTDATGDRQKEDGKINRRHLILLILLVQRV
eukprot:CAMPEP_0184871598 /NCGR_PEP_ID=MMETSP0580-20130426/40813_1 /TAXON_ID=1118495 /ORGANISM="Dactyliosolen fragilissimus" /LENGTH=154 /DNA_ID=CAMNT_0027374281 /DNA_START=245 /DNA_END=709 /DNA_ORIENTATION=+